MFLKRLELRNVRSIEHIDFSFDCADASTRKWTVILGENGCGKSTILRAAALLTAGSDALSELIGSPESWIRNGHSISRLRATLVTAQQEERHVEIELHKKDTMIDVFERNARTLKELDLALTHAVRNFTTVGYGVSRRLSPSPDHGSSGEGIFRSKRAQAVATMFSPDATLQSLQSWAMDVHYRKRKSGLALVREALKDLLPGVEFDRIDPAKRKMYFRTMDGIVPLEQLSDGYQNVAAWCGDLVYRVTDLNPDCAHPLNARGLLLLDEIDLHLHPVWQRQLRNYINQKFPNFQILATTHSPLMAQQCGPEELFVLRRTRQSEAAILEQYQGEPSKLMVQQLIVSPLFGVATVDSPQVQHKKNELKLLRHKKSLTSQDKSRLKTLKAELKDLPDWTTQSAADREQVRLLHQIERELQGKNGRAAQNSGSKRSSRKR